MAAPAFLNAVYFVAGSSGTAAFADGTAEAGFRNMAGASASNGTPYSYRAESADRSQWEIGIGTYNSGAGTLARTTVHAGSNGTSAVDFSEPPYVMLTPLAADLAGKQTVWIPASAMTPALTAGAAGPIQRETATNDLNYWLLDFDASADEYAHFNVAFPNSWDHGPVTFQVFWEVDAGVSTGVAFGLQTTPISDANGIDAAWNTPTIVTDDAQGSAGELYVTGESGPVAVTGVIPNDLTFFRLFRDVSDANDDMSQDARVMGVRLFYTTRAGTDA